MTNLTTTFFGRCIFLSWYCERATCNFCFRSTTKHQIKHSQNAKRSLASVLTDAIIGKHMGWEIEFLTGGYGIFDFDEIVQITKHVSDIYKQKIWVNLGSLKKEEMQQLKPYIEGVCASIETIEPNLHNHICPDKAIEPYTKMLKIAKEIGLKTSITIVIGLGEKKEDFELLADYITDNNLDRITFYALKPVQGTPYTESPDPEYYSWWIKQTRMRFPKIKIMAGLTPKKIDYTKWILDAGANGITKFPALKAFGNKNAYEVENQAKLAGREFIGTLTKLPDIDWDDKVDELALGDKLKEDIKIKINQYLDGIKRNIINNEN